MGTWYFRLGLLLGSLLLVGALFKLLHWAGADVLLLVSLGGLALTYAMRFARKQAKSQFDVLKLVLVLGSCGSTLLLLLHLAPREVRYLPPCLLALAVLDFLYVENQKWTAAQ